MAKRYELPDTARELIADMVSPPSRKWCDLAVMTG